jgi:hypothetical protein
VKLNNAISDYPANIGDTSHLQSSRERSCHEQSLADRVSSKLEDGDVRGAVRLASSEDTLAQHTSDTYQLLSLQRPVRHQCNNELPSPTAGLVSNALQLSETDIRAGIKSFAAGSANGLDGLCPQHLKDLTSGVHGASGDRLVSRLTEFANLCLRAAFQLVFSLYFAVHRCVH